MWAYSVSENGASFLARVGSWQVWHLAFNTASTSQGKYAPVAASGAAASADDPLSLQPASTSPTAAIAIQPGIRMR